MAQQQEACRRISLLWEGKHPYACVTTYGCQQNEADSERIAGMLEQMGYTLTQDQELADLIVFNTCAVREHAELKALSKTGQLKHLKVQKPSLLIVLCGCMVQQEHRMGELKQSYPYVDAVIGTHALHRLPEILLSRITLKRRQFCIPNEDGLIAEGLPIHRQPGPKAFVSVSWGCNNFCTYCVVPHVRGRERSRQPDLIEAELRQALAQGALDITLLGQNVNSYGHDLPQHPDFASLLTRLANVEGNFRLRFMTSHPKDASVRLFEAMASSPKIMPHLHLPVQSGSSRILRRMNRGYTKEQYLALAEQARKTVPSLALTTDIIVGFPGETEEDFRDTLDVVEQVGFESAFTFIYSPRKGTPAADYEDQVPREVADERMARLLKLQETVTLRRFNEQVGKTVEVLIDTADEFGCGGRTPDFKMVHIPSCTSLRPGDFASVRITQAKLNALIGELCPRENA
ncbi:MAG: tRNA (N6-isopentenyl adenosine(37)-C2)-methylthiotransferase MiaB [Clostridia bacterium]|nr:tRNA (N6-isopentenyl adenosine(37)-C2)-methylthiotransferase MiaB [Clostridia bacterium]